MTVCRLVWLSTCLFLLPSLSSADIYRCTEGGKTIYSDKPCGGDMVKNPAPSAPVSTISPIPIDLQTEADAGRIAVGMTMKQVERAWGKPATTRMDEGAQGITERWTYIRDGEETEIFIRSGAVAMIGGPYAVAAKPLPPDEPLRMTAAEFEKQKALDEEQERLEKSGERRFVREGMTQDAVRERIGPPADTKVSSNLWGVGTYWIYPPTPDDPQTRTLIRFNRDGGHVISVDRSVER